MNNVIHSLVNTEVVIVFKEDDVFKRKLLLVIITVLALKLTLFGTILYNSAFATNSLLEEQNVYLPIVLAHYGETPPNNIPGILFESNRDGNYDIFLINDDGTNVIKVIGNADDDRYASWSPDGTRIAYASRRGGNTDIYVANLDGSAEMRLTTAPEFDSFPCWSPDGERIAFSSDRNGDAEIYVMDADGSNQTRLTNIPNYDSRPSWSPDGSRIAFTSSDGIYVIAPDGTGLSQLSNGDGDADPDWSPDGSLIVFDSVRTGTWAIYTMESNGDNQTRIGVDTSDNYMPVWSPDGEKIAFTSLRDGNNEIYIMNKDGTSTNRMTVNPAIDWFADW